MYEFDSYGAQRPTALGNTRSKPRYDDNRKHD